MEISLNTRQAYSEVDEFLKLLSSDQINKIPIKLREIFSKEKDFKYKKVIKPNEPIKNQNLKEESLEIIAWLNLEYWCENEQERERLRSIYAKNQKMYQETFQIAFNSDDIFKNKTLINEDKLENIEHIQMIEYKESFIKNIINKIKKIFFK